MAKTRSVLGKGLSALIPGAAETPESREPEAAQVARELRTPPSALARPEERPEPAINKIEIARIAPNPQQPRKDFPQAPLDELAQSIREHGIIQAITVRKVAPDRFELVSGERRVRAAIEAGLTEIPAYVLEVESDRKMLELAIIENVQRLQFNPIEEAEAYQRLIEDCNLTQEEVAEKIAKDRTTVANFLRLLRLPESIKDSLRNGELGLGHAKAVMGVPDAARQVELWKSAVEHHYSVRKLEELARAASREIQGLPPEPSIAAKSDGKGTKAVAKGKAAQDGETIRTPELDSIENSFKHLLGTQVKVRLKPDETGEVAIQFYSYEDLERIRELLDTIQHH